jgi:hypothetical protein
MLKPKSMSGFMDCDFGESLTCMFRTCAPFVTAIGRQHTGGTIDASQTKYAPVLNFPFGSGDIRSRQTEDSLAIAWESRRQKVQQLLCAVPTTCWIICTLWKGDTREQANVDPIHLSKGQDHKRNVLLWQLWSERLNVERSLFRFRSPIATQGQQRRNDQQKLATNQRSHDACSPHQSCGFPHHQGERFRWEILACSLLLNLNP